MVHGIPDKKRAPQCWINRKTIQTNQWHHDFVPLKVKSSSKYQNAKHIGQCFSRCIICNTGVLWKWNYFIKKKGSSGSKTTLCETTTNDTGNEPEVYSSICKSYTLHMKIRFIKRPWNRGSTHWLPVLSLQENVQTTTYDCVKNNRKRFLSHIRKKWEQTQTLPWHPATAPVR